MIGFDTSVFPRLDPADPEGFRRLVRGLSRFFEGSEDVRGLRIAVDRLKEAFEDIDPFIQEYTRAVCPYCGTVCCAQIHGLPEFADVAGFLAMGLAVPEYDLGREIKGPCQFIGPRGCLLPRIQRPYRCTWYFCDPLLVQIEIGPPAHYRSFINKVEALSQARGDLMRAFHLIWTETRGDTKPC